MLTELIDEGFTVTEERVLPVPTLEMSRLELVVELVRLAWASFLFIVQTLTASRRGETQELKAMSQREPAEVGEARYSRCTSGHFSMRAIRRRVACGGGAAVAARCLRQGVSGSKGRIA